MLAAGTGSSHTVCQMPEDEVNMISALIQRLLSAGFAAAIHRAVDVHDQFLRPASAQIGSDVVAKGNSRLNEFLRSDRSRKFASAS